MSLTTKRIIKELEQLRNDPPSSFVAQFINNNLYEWHFTIKGPANSDYSEGIYHGKIELPVDYPIKPPNIFFLTPNGRFEIKTKICLNITKFHPENWNPSWTIRTMIEGIIQHFHVKDYAVGSIQYSSKQIKALAQASHKWECDICGPISKLIAPTIIKEIEIVNTQKNSEVVGPSKIPEVLESSQFKEQEKPTIQSLSKQIKEKDINKEAESEEKEIDQNQELEESSNDELEQEIPITKIKSSDEIEKFLWNILNPEFLSKNNVKITKFSKQQQQQQNKFQQFQYFDQIYQLMEEEEQALQTLKIQKNIEEQNTNVENNNNNLNPEIKQQNYKSQIMMINIILFALIFGIVIINFGEYLEQQTKEWLLIK